MGKDNIHPGETDRDDKLIRRAEEDALAADIIDECRTQLMLKFRFLDLALWRMDLEPYRGGAMYALMTDGHKLMYDPVREIGRFQQSYDETIRDYLHMIMHCVFRHPFDRNKHSRDVWDLTCDIIVENAIMDLVGARFKSDDDMARIMEISKIKMAAGGLTPGKIYKLIDAMEHIPEGQEHHGIPTSKLNEWRSLFERDDHSAWPVHAKPDSNSDASDQRDADDYSEGEENDDIQSDGLRADSPEGQTAEDSRGQRDKGADESDEANVQASGGKGDNDSEDDNDEMQDEIEQQDEPKDDGDEDEDAGSDGESSSDAEGSHDSTDERNSDESDEEVDSEKDEKDWEEISKQIEMNLQTFSKEWGNEAGSLIANLQAANRKTHDYYDFLNKFMILSEEMQLNMEEFDNIFYTFGLDLYGNMPLVEPLEYKETKAIRDFAIIIDTSESVSGELVKEFVQQTFEILKSSEEYAHEVNIHVIQADSKVQSDAVIKDLRDVDRFLEGFQVRGFGGTDFRPAFDYVAMLQKKGKLEDLKGVIYFTDGYGNFPEKAPEFDAAFVFMDDGEREIPPVPPWAIKVVLNEHSFDA